MLSDAQVIYQQDNDLMSSNALLCNIIIDIKWLKNIWLVKLDVQAYNIRKIWFGISLSTAKICCNMYQLYLSIVILTIQHTKFKILIFRLYKDNLEFNNILHYVLYNLI